ncbi:longitudinals lacking protein-like isoform X1 [Pectinophora gossypiella]|uniref:BTB domain-containing protein n=1 Tax=Pectinophora gossypiella TaxID=13191 RepID=A0A1E1W6Z3_PECGO|nr:longitudinals lacking protein-like isoform X1 [Pectinophora gossypiella]
MRDGVFILRFNCLTFGECCETLNGVLGLQFNKRTVGTNKKKICASFNTRKSRKTIIMGDQQFFLKWNDFQTNMVTSFRHLRDEKSFTDVTLACEGQTCKAHKMVLSACSPYFKSLLEENPSKHPIIILKDVSYLHLQAILEFMYAGEVNVSQEQLPAFLKTAARLKVKGLAEPPPQMPSIKREG